MKTPSRPAVSCSPAFGASLSALVILCGLCGCASDDNTVLATGRDQPRRYEHQETQDLVALVKDAAALVEAEGEVAFDKLRTPGSRWRRQETYVFVLDPAGKMLVHADPDLEGKATADLKDINGRPIIRGLIDAATSVPDKPEGWYHYEWPVPGGLLPRWKSSYVRLATAPSGQRFVVGSGVYNDRMERAFVVDMVKGAVAEIESRGENAFGLLRDRTGPFIAKDAYVFVVDPQGVELVNPGFPNLQGRNLLDVKDKQGKRLVREMFNVVENSGSGWVDYMWPKPGEAVSSRKSAYVSKARVAPGRWLLVGAGVYLADAPKAAPDSQKLTTGQLMALVREGAALFEKAGDAAYAEFRTKGSKWFRDDTYFIVYTLDGIRTFHGADPSLEGKDVSDARDVQGRPYGRMFRQIGASPSGEGWVHYMYPEPGDIFPAWKSTFIKRVRSPSGKQHLIGSAVYNMKMEKAFIEDVVNRAAALVATHGEAAFDQLRDKTGPFVFMDTYVFVDSPDGTERVNTAYPAVEGKNLLDVKDVNGKALVREYIEAASKAGSAWVEYYWYKPGQNIPVRKQAYVRRVRHGADTYFVGSGLYLEE